MQFLQQDVMKNAFMAFAMRLINVDAKMVGLETLVMNVSTWPDANMADAKASPILANVTKAGKALCAMYLFAI